MKPIADNVYVEDLYVGGGEDEEGADDFADPDADLDVEDVGMQESSGEDAPEVSKYDEEIPGMATLAATIDSLVEEVESMGLPRDSKLHTMAKMLPRQLSYLKTIVSRRAKRMYRDEAINVIKFRWKLYMRNLSADQVYYLNRTLGIPQADIAQLLRKSGPAITSCIARHESKLIPDMSIPDEMSEDEKAEYVLKKIYKAATSDKIDRESVNAAKVFLEIYSKKVERSTLEKWRQVEIVSEFFFSKLLPTIHRNLSLAGSKVDIRALCLPLFSGVADEVRKVVMKAKFKEDRKEPEKKKSGKKGAK